MKRTACFVMTVLLMMGLALGVHGQEAIPQGYRQIIEGYTQARTDGWDEEKLIEEGLNMLAAGREDLGYALADLDEDDNEELLIAPLTQEGFFAGMVFDLYALQDGQAVKVFSSGERDRYYYIGKDLFVHQGSSSAQDSFDTTSRYGEGRMTDLGYPTEEKEFAQLPLILFEGALSLPNPWQQTSAQGIVEQVGVTFGVPLEAQDIAYSAMGSQLAQMRFTWKDMECNARIKPASSFEDISGLNYAWDREEDCQVGWCEGKMLSAGQGEEKISLCLWYDVAPGLMYSLGASGPMENQDLLNLAQEIFIPAQSEAE